MSLLQFQLIATHHKMAPVARLMGFTVEGLAMLSADVHTEWQSIGRTRSIAGQPGDNVLARRPKPYPCDVEECDRDRDFQGAHFHGTLEFSIGVKGLILTDESMRRKLARDMMARELVAKVIQSRSFTIQQLDRVIKGLSHSSSHSSSQSNGSNAGMNESPIHQAAEPQVSPLAPRSHDS